MKIEDLRGVLPRAEVERLPSGLTLCRLESGNAPIVSTALAYRAGSRDDTPGHGGTAHFLEHMMFKGTARVGPGEIDRRTRRLGGSNNAFTSHDLTLYDFSFAADRWTEALELEVDRMAGLLLDPKEVASEKQVILEEVSMYESEPWDALEQEVAAAFYGEHPYGRPVLGTREDLGRIDGEVLGEFHRRHYRPSEAVLVVAGDVDGEARERVAEAFAGFPRVPRPAMPRAADDRRISVEPPTERLRVERRFGETARLLLMLPAPPAGHPDHACLRLLVAILAHGRSSRLHRALVDEGQLCLGVAADLSEPIDPGVVHVAAQLLPGVDPEEVEEEILAQIARLRSEPPSAAELARARRSTLADWTFGHERIQQQGFLAATSLALFDLEHPWRYLERQLGATPDELAEVAGRYLDPSRGGVTGWSLPTGEAR